MNAIDTLYKGNFFRSRLEARWAVFFNTLGLRYEYEPEGFTDGKGSMYLPDFYLPDVCLRDTSHMGVFIEVKPESYDLIDIPASEWFSGNLALVKGLPNGLIWGDWGGNGSNEMYQLCPWWDNYMRFYMCKDCGCVKIEFSESNYAYCPSCKSENCDYNALEYAAAKASTARFEHNNYNP
jgi:hypothetical protein